MNRLQKQTGFVITSVLCLLLSAVSSLVVAQNTEDETPYDPLFLLRGVEGYCTLQKPGTTNIIVAVGDRAYPFGTTIHTSQESASTIYLNPMNVCRIYDSATATFTASSPAARQVLLTQGNMEVKTQEKFKPFKTLIVKTPGGIECDLRTAQLILSVNKSATIETTRIEAKDGMMDLKVPHLLVQAFSKDMTVEVQSQFDGTFHQLKGLKGTIIVSLKDKFGDPRQVELKPGQIIKIWSSPVPGNRTAVRGWITSADGSLLTTEDGGLDRAKGIISFLDEN